MNRLAAVLLAACASVSTEPPSLDAAKARTWRQVDTAHFSILTDSNDPGKLGVVFEGYFAAMAQCASAAMLATTAPPSDKIDVTVFERESDYDAVAPPHTNGFFFAWYEGKTYKSRVFVTASLDADNQRTLKHELVHRFVAHHLPAAPRWLHEGLAQYFATFAEENGALLIGRPDPRRVFVRGDNVYSEGEKDVVNTMRLPAVSEILDAPPESFSHYDSAGAHYAASWLLVHLLMTNAKYDGARTAYFDLLARGVDEHAARKAAFSNTDLSALDAEYRTSAHARERQLWRIAVDKQPATAPVVTDMDGEKMQPHWDVWAQFRKSWAKTDSR